MGMMRKVMAVVAGLAVWVVVTLIAGAVIRAVWVDYVRVAEDMRFTLGMKLTRLAIGAVATIAAGWVAQAIARTAALALITGVVLLVVFIPQHISLWDKFPIWYHLTFLLSLVPLGILGGRAAGRWRRRSFTAP